MSLLTSRSNKENELDINTLKKLKVMHHETSDSPVDLNQTSHNRVDWPSLDENVSYIMRHHQIEAANFLIERLMGNNTNRSNRTDYNSVEMPESHITGAILADDVGTGKTLTSLSILWAFIRRGKIKAMIVCPSSLVEHWRNEIKKWLPPNLSRVALFAFSSINNKDSNANTIVGHFVKNPPEVHPLLVISYELYRNFSDALNNISSLELLVCDEGHRLKNAYGTKTSVALERSLAIRRLVLTGTPIQNNLEELYAVIQFAIPWYLGTLKEFKLKYIDPIKKYKNSSSYKPDEMCPSELLLREKLKRIMIRRTKDEVMQSILPPRVELILRVGLNSTQKSQYIEEISSLNVENNLDNQFKTFLPKLLRLRLLCTKADPIPTYEDDTTPMNDDKQIHAQTIARSHKLKTLETLLIQIKKYNPNDKVIIASNFLENLDACKCVSKFHGWSSLRLDGSLPGDKRQKLIDIFNNPKYNYFILFLSTKAGGVGLNLTGANRLILLEPDWNPAVDIQTMGRIWREGQTKPVYIYRMIADKTIEDGILASQFIKRSMNNLIYNFDDKEVVDDDLYISQNILNEDILESRFTIKNLLESILSLNSQMNCTISSCDGTELFSTLGEESISISGDNKYLPRDEKELLKSIYR